MNKLALILAAATLCAPASLAAGQQAPVAAQTQATAHCVITALAGRGRSIDVDHPLIDGVEFGNMGGRITICAQRRSKEVITREEAIAAARTFMNDTWADYGCKEHMDAEWNERIHEWEIPFLCKKPLIPPPPFNPPKTP
jgi:hypothetical protein